MKLFSKNATELNFCIKMQPAKSIVLFVPIENCENNYYSKIFISIFLPLRWKPLLVFYSVSTPRTLSFCDYYIWLGAQKFSLDSNLGLGISAAILLLSVVSAHFTFIIDQEAKDRKKRKEMGWDDEYLVSFHNIQAEQTNRKIKMTIIIESNVRNCLPLNLFLALL